MSSTTTGHRDDPADAPHPEDDRKPDSPTEVTKPSWKYILRTTVREFSADGCTDLAAGLTYRTVLSIFPALIALVSILSLFGQSESSVTAVLDQAERDSAADPSAHVTAPTVRIVPARAGLRPRSCWRISGR